MGKATIDLSLFGDAKSARRYTAHPAIEFIYTWNLPDGRSKASRELTAKFRFEYSDVQLPDGQWAIEYGVPELVGGTYESQTGVPVGIGVKVLFVNVGASIQDMLLADMQYRTIATENSSTLIVIIKAEMVAVVEVGLDGTRSAGSVKVKAGPFKGKWLIPSGCGGQTTFTIPIKMNRTASPVGPVNFLSPLSQLNKPMGKLLLAGPRRSLAAPTAELRLPPTGKQQAEPVFKKPVS